MKQRVFKSIISILLTVSILFSLSASFFVYAESKYGYVGIYTEYEPFVVEGVNEAGLSAGLFFFPQYGEYAPYKQADNAKTLCDMQFVSWVLSQFSTIDQMKEELQKIDLVTLDHKIGAVHWRIT